MIYFIFSHLISVQVVTSLLLGCPIKRGELMHACVCNNISIGDKQKNNTLCTPHTPVAVRSAGRVRTSKIILNLFFKSKYRFHLVQGIIYFLQELQPQGCLILTFMI